jgi:membrane-associated protease RseP (regulator of RpoE activity)
MDQFGTQEQSLAERMLRQVQTVMDVHESDAGTETTPYLARFRGKLKLDSHQAYEKLAPQFANEGASILLRGQGGSHTLLAIDEIPQPGPGRIWLNIVLFAATFVAVLLVGLNYGAGYLGLDPNLEAGELTRRALPLAALYAVSLLGILLAHEFGHYLAGRYHNTAVSLPFFIPLPIQGSLLGTMGAFIQLKTPPKNRRVLLDIGMAGPLAGLLVALPVLLIGLALSDVGTLPSTAREAAGSIQEGNSILYLGLKYLVHGELLPAPASLGDADPILYWGRYLLTGEPAPFGGRDVQLHPMAFAGWAGFLVTGLNLIPAGQLDGGHGLFSLLGRNASRLWLPIVVVLGLMGLLIWEGWLIFTGLVFFFGRAHATPLDDVTELDPARKAVAILGLVLFVLLFTPVPIRLLAAP